MPFARPHRPRHTPNSSCSSSPPSTPDSSTLSLSSHVQQKQNQKQKRRLGSTTILAALRLRLSREPHADSDSDPGNMGQAQAKPAGPCATHPAFAYPMSGETSTHRMPGGMDDVADSALALSEIHPPLSAPPALGSASASKTLKSRSLARKLSTKRPHATVSHSAAHRAKAARTLGEEMAAFEKLVHQAELAAGIEATVPHASDGAAAGSGARAARLRMSLPPTPPKVRPVTSANDLASTSASASAIPARMRSSSGLQRRSSTFSTQSSGVSPTASRRAEREWRAKVAALAASSATMTPLYHTPSRSSIVVSPPIRGPVPPRRPFPAAVPATPLMVRSASVDSHGSSNLPVTPPAPRTPLMTVPLKHGRTHSSSRSFASRRSFETLGHHAGQGLGLGSCFPAPSPGGVGEGHERHARQASVPQSISSYYLGVTSRPPSAAAASLLGQVALTPMPLSPSSPESPAIVVDVDVARGQDVDMANAEKNIDAAVPPRLPTPVSASPLFVPRVISPTPPAPLDTVLPNSEGPATSDLPATPVEIAQTPVRTTFAAKPQPADSPSVYSQRSASTSTSTRTRSMPSPPSFSPAHTPRRKPTHGLTLDFVRTPLHSRARHLASGSPGPGTPTYSPTTAYILCAPIENVWANTLAFHDSPPRPDAHAHPYALPPWGLSGAVSAPVKPPKTQVRHKPAQGEAANGKERIPLAPAPAALQQQQRSEEQVGSDPFLISVSQGSCTPRGANALREVNLTPGMDTGKRPPKSGLPMDDLTRWLATTSIAA